MDEELAKILQRDKCTRKMLLLVWEGDYGLASIDSECLHVIVYCMLTKAPVTIKQGRSSMLNYKKYPLLITEGMKLRSVHDIISYLRLHGYTLDYNIGLKQCTDSYAFANILMKRFKEISYYMWWIDEDNYNKLTYPWYVKAMPFPFNYLYPRYYRKMSRRFLDGILPQEKDSTKAYINCLATETFQTLSGRLADSQFIYGDRPCSLDVLVYAYLAPLLYIPFPSNEIVQLLKTWSSLVSYTERMHNTFFPESRYNCKYLDRSKWSEDEIPNATFHLPLIFACLFLVGAAYFKKFIQ